MQVTNSAPLNLQVSALHEILCSDKHAAKNENQLFLKIHFNTEICMNMSNYVKK